MSTFIFGRFRYQLFQLPVSGVARKKILLKQSLYIDQIEGLDSTDSQILLSQMGGTAFAD